MSKIILGTVQFGVDYGINNSSGRVSQDEVQTMLKIASKYGVNTLDTSSGYGISEQVLGKALKQTGLQFNIVSKYPTSNICVRETFWNSLNNLGVKSLYGYLVHHFEFFQRYPHIYDDMKRLKEEGFIKKIGFSIYNTEQLQCLLDHHVEFDLIQFPYNIFDRQFEHFMPELVEMNVEIHTRSAFLQGLFFKDTNTLPSKLLPLKPYLDNLHEYCQDNNVIIEELSLGYVLVNENVKGALVGVDNHYQLESNILVAKKTIRKDDIDYIRSIDIKEKELLNPVNWN